MVTNIKSIVLGSLASLSILLLTACGPTEFGKNLKDGRQAVEDEKYDLAVEKLSLAVSIEPDHEEANKLLKKAEGKLEAEEKEIKEQKKRNKEELKKKKEIDDFFKTFDNDTPEGKVRIAMYDVLKTDYDKPSAISISSVIDEEGHITAVGKGKDGWSNDSIRDGFFEDITNILKKVKDVDGFNSISISLTFPMQDTYGNTNDDEVVSMLFEKSEIDKINFISFNYLNLPDVAEGFRLYPAFQ